MSHPSVVTSNLTSPSLPLGIFSSRLIWILICQTVSILDGQSLGYSANHLLSTVLAVIFKSWWRTKNEQLTVAMCMTGDLNYISSRYVYSSSFISLEKCVGGELNNLVWPRLARRIRVYIFFTGAIIWLMFCFFTAREQARVSLKIDLHGGRRSSISSTVMYLDYIFCFIGSHERRAQSWVSSKRTAFILFYYVQIHVYLKSVHSGPEIQGYHLTQLGVPYLGSYIFFPLICGNFSTLLRRWEDVRICWNQLHSGLPLIESQMNWNKIYYFKFQTWNLALRPACL